MFLVASVFVPATAFAAGGGSLSAVASNIAPTVGTTFTVDVKTTSDVVSSGASASLTFNQSKLQIISVDKGVDWNVAGSNWVAFPTAAVISAANVSGTLPTVGVFLNSPATLPAASATLLRVTFFASGPGASDITLPVAPATGGMLDGQAATYGDALTVTTAPITITPSGTANTGSVTTNISGTVDSGFVALSCPANLTIPLVRNVNNTVEAICSVAANVTWQLSAADTNPAAATVGHMRDQTVTPNKVLQDPLHVSSTVGGTYDHNLADTVQSPVVASGQNNVAASLTLSQFARPSDPAGIYGIQVLFTVVSVF
jgi:hypothetical protein